ncbi:MAG: ThuA domain-containing protein [Caldilineaceae bacterium]
MQRMLVICDDKHHPAATPRAGLAPLSGQQYAFDWIEKAEDWSAARMAAYPVVILTKANNVSASDATPWMRPEIETAFADYVRKGGGLLVIHSGTAGYDEAATLRALIGGVFVRHPKQCPVTVTPHRDHPLARGGAVFTQHDEHYFMAMDDAHIELLLTSSSEHGEQPAGWTRTEGDGRVCVLTPGHNLPVWLEPGYQTLIDNALQWCGKQ